MSEDKEESEVDIENEFLLQSVAKIQSLIRTFICRCRIIKVINTKFEKIFDPVRKRYYYYDTVHDSTSWNKPVLLLDRCDINVISPTYSRDHAATMIQTRGRMMKSLYRVRILYQSTLITTIDAASSDKYYFNPKSGVTMWQLPSFMNGRLDHYDYDKENENNIKKKTKKKSKAKNKSEGEEIDESLDGKEDNSDDDSDRLSEDTEARKERRKLEREYPRSKVQSLVDAAEDGGKEFIELNLSGIGAKRFTSRIYNLVDLMKLNLSHNNLTRISTDLQYLTNLTSLDLSNNSITKVPPFIDELKQLTDIRLANNKLISYPGHLYKLKKLQYIDFSNNMFKEIPTETGNLELLKDLNQWDITIEILVNLTHIDFSNNNISIWPPNIEKLTLLNVLKLSNNELETVPSKLQTFTNLEVLDISHNKLQSVTTDIYSLSLVTLLMNNNSLLNFPDVDYVGKYSMKYLKTLNISNNEFSEIDEKVAIFSKLDSFKASNNKINKISDSISTLTILKYFDLSHNELESIPSGFGGCKQLLHLDLSFNKFIDIPNPLVSNVKLITLKINNNLLQHEISGKVFGLLTDLESLEMQYNQITVLPDLLYTLKKIQFLNISYNQIGILNNSISSLKGLKIAHFNNNKITEVSSSISTLTKLTTIELDNNLLKDLPLSISTLKNISHITLHSNNLLQSPNLLKLLPKLISYNLSWNLNIKANLKDYEKLSKSYNSKKDYISVDILKFKLLQASNQMDKLLNIIPLKIPLFKNEIITIEEKDDLNLDEPDESAPIQSPTVDKDKVKSKGKKKKKNLTNLEKESLLLEKTFKWLEQIHKYFIKNIDRNININFISILSNLSMKDISSEILVTNKINQLLYQSKIQLLTILKNIDINRKLSFDLNDYLCQDLTLPDNNILSTFDLGYILQDQIENYQKLAHETVSLIIIDELKYLSENIDKSENILLSESNKKIDLKKEKDWDPNFVWVCDFDENSSILDFILIGDFFDEIIDTKKNIKLQIKENIINKRCVYKSRLYDYEIIINKSDNLIKDCNFSILFGFQSSLENEKGIKLNFTSLKFNKEKNVEGLMTSSVGDNRSITLIRYDRLHQELVNKYSNLFIPYSPSSNYNENIDQQLLDLAMGKHIVLNQSVVNKKDIIDFNELPFLFHSLPLNREGNDELIESLFSCYINMSKLLIKRSEYLRDAIRIIEIRGKLEISSLDVAQRRDDDMIDILGNLYDRLAEEAATSVSSKSKESTHKKTNKVSSITDTYVALGLETTTTNDDDDEGDGDGHIIESTDDETNKSEKNEIKKKKKTKKSKKGKKEELVEVEVKKELTIADIIPKIDKLVPLIDPIAYPIAKANVNYLNQMRLITLVWAYKILTCAENILFSNGYNIKSRHYRHKHRNPIPVKDWIRDGMCQLHYNQALLYKYLQLYDKSEYEYKLYFKICNNNVHINLNIELIKVYTAQGKYIAANNCIRELIFKLFPENLKSDPPNYLDIIKKNKILGYLKVIVDKNIENLEYCGVYSEDKPNFRNINDNGEAILNTYSITPPEVKGGRTLRDHSVLLKRAKKVEEEELIQQEDDMRNDIRNKIVSALDKARSILKS